MWSSQRCNTSGYPNAECCPRRGATPLTDMHEQLTCPALSTTLEEPIRLSNHLIAQATATYDTQSVKWARGLLPKAEVATPPPQTTYIPATTGIFSHNSPKLKTDNLLFAIDESGGQFASEPVLRRTGWAIAATTRHQDDSIQVVGVMWSPLPGPRQTSARACLHGVDHLLASTEGTATIAPD